LWLSPRAAGPLATDERADHRRVRRENPRLKTEREILAQATGWFARETTALVAAASTWRPGSVLLPA
jgi:transposase-like protein